MTFRFYCTSLLLTLIGCAEPTSPQPLETDEAVVPGCEGTTPYTPVEWDTTAPITERIIDPATIDARITDAPELRHFVYLADEQPKRGELLVFFSGSKQGINEASNLLNLSAWLGYHAISLAYSNKVSVNKTCQQETTPSEDCHGDVLEEKIYGTDASPLLEVTEANGIMWRLYSLVQHLNTTYPDEGWDAFIDGEALQWSNIAVAGGSQGGKVSAYISRDHATARAILFSAMGSAYNNGGVPEVALWSQQERATPITRTYGLWHAEEAANNYAPVILEAYGVDSLGDVVDVDDTDPPYSCSHQLRTALLPSSGEMDDAHTSLGSDRLQAMDGDQPTLTPTYIYMMTAAHD